MNNFPSYPNYYLQFWMVPNMMNAGAPLFSPVNFYPQLVPQQLGNFIINTSLPPSTHKLPQLSEKSEEKNEPKIVNEEVTQKSENQKITVQIDSSVSKQQNQKPEQKKAKRPQTYLTEKAFYMKQILKGKQKGDSRILRRRLKVKQLKNFKVVQGEKSGKKNPEQLRMQRKKLPIAKDSQKQRKIVTKIKLKLFKQYRDQFAQIPRLISGISHLNEFYRAKVKNLLTRQIISD